MVKFKKIASLAIIALFILLGTKSFVRPIKQIKKVPLHKPESYATKVPVLTYHDFVLGNQEHKYARDDSVLPIELFDEQMRYLYQNGYKTITLPELENFVKHKTLLPLKSVAITMDDGYESDYKLAYPILKKYHFKATIFIIGKYIRQDGVKSKGPFPFLTYSEMKNSEDVFSFSSHTFNLHRTIGHKPALAVAGEDQIVNDLEIEKDFLSQFNYEPYFAYPFGGYSDKVIRALKKVGIRMAFTTKEGDVMPGDNPYMLKRHIITPAVSFDEFKAIMGDASYKDRLKIRFNHLIRHVHKIL